MRARAFSALMASRREIQEKRALVAQRHRAATRKVSRLKAKGVEVSGTKVDPRRNLSNVKRYTEKQLDSYLSELNNFTSRKTTFAPGVKGKPLEGSLWNQYLGVQKAYNAMTAKQFESVKDIFLPSHGTTIEGLQASKPLHPISGNPASRAPNVPVDRSSKGIPGDKQIKKLIKDLRNKMRPDYQANIDKRNKKTAMKMLIGIGDLGILEDIGAMSQKKFATLWNYTNFAMIASFDYAIAKSQYHDNKTLAWHDAAFDTQLKEMRKMIKEINETKI